MKYREILAILQESDSYTDIVELIHDGKCEQALGLILEKTELDGGAAKTAVLSLKMELDHTFGNGKKETEAYEKQERKKEEQKRAEELCKGIQPEDLVAYHTILKKVQEPENLENIKPFIMAGKWEEGLAYLEKITPLGYIKNVFLLEELESQIYRDSRQELYDSDYFEGIRLLILDGEDEKARQEMKDMLGWDEMKVQFMLPPIQTELCWKGGDEYKWKSGLDYEEMVEKQLSGFKEAKQKAIKDLKYESHIVVGQNEYNSKYEFWEYMSLHTRYPEKVVKILMELEITNEIAKTIYFEYARTRRYPETDPPQIDYQPPKCPTCGSTHVRSIPYSFAQGFLLGDEYIVNRKQKECLNCGYQW